MFQLKKEEVPKEFSKSQIVTLNENVTPSELRLVTAKVSEISVQVAGVVDWKNKSEDRFDNIQRSIDALSENFVLEKDFKNFVIYKGQKFEADAAYIDIYQQAKKSIYVVDNM